MRSLQDTRGFLVYVLPAVVYTVLIFWLGCTHINITVQQDYVPQDKLEHLGAFGVLTWLAFRALAFELIRLSTGRLIVASTVISSLMGALLEAWQSLFPHRSVEFGDWVADTLGAGLVGIILLLWIRKGRRHML